MPIIRESLQVISILDVQNLQGLKDAFSKIESSEGYDEEHGGYEDDYFFVLNDFLDIQSDEDLRAEYIHSIYFEEDDTTVYTIHYVYNENRDYLQTTQNFIQNILNEYPDLDIRVLVSTHYGDDISALVGFYINDEDEIEKAVNSLEYLDLTKAELEEFIIDFCLNTEFIEELAEECLCSAHKLKNRKI